MKHESFIKGIIDILQKRNVIKQTEALSLKKVFKDANKPYLDDFLLGEGLIDKEDLLNALAEYYQVPAFDVVGYFFDHSVVRMFPREFLMSNAIIPLERDDNILTVVASNPGDTELLPKIGNYVSYDIQFRVGIRRDILDAIEEFFDQSLTEVDYDQELEQERMIREGEVGPDIEELNFDEFGRRK